MRKSKTAEQQAKFYECGNDKYDFFNCLIEVYINGNFSSFERMFKELIKSDRYNFIKYVMENYENNEIVDACLKCTFK